MNGVFGRAFSVVTSIGVGRFAGYGGFNEALLTSRVCLCLCNLCLELEMPTVFDRQIDISVDNDQNKF